MKKLNQGKRELMQENTTKANVDRFKHFISDYDIYLHDLENAKLKKLELDAKRGVHAVRYDLDKQGIGDPLNAALKRIDDMELSDKLEKDIEYYKRIVDLIKNYIDVSKYGESVYLIYAKKSSTYYKESKKHYMSIRSLKRNINKDMESYLKIGTEYLDI